MTNYLGDVLGFLEGKRNEIKPEYTRVGKPVYTLRNWADLTDIDAEVLNNGGVANIAERVPSFGARGNLLRTPRTSYAVNIEIAFDNRVKVVEREVSKGKKESLYLFVIDQRALEEQKSGHIYANFINAYVIGKGEDGEPEVRGVEHIKEDEFVNDFDQTMDASNMESVMELINDYRMKHGTNKIIEELKF